MATTETKRIKERSEEPKAHTTVSLRLSHHFLLEGSGAMQTQPAKSGSRSLHITSVYLSIFTSSSLVSFVDLISRPFTPILDH